MTDEMVALHHHYHHRKPVTAKTQMLGGDQLVVVLGGVYTDVEKTMIEVQRSTIVQETRNAFQNAMQHKFIAAIERLSGRGVLAFISNHHVGPDKDGLRAGACGFLFKDTRPRELLHAIEVVAAGEALIAPSITRRLIARVCGPPRSGSTVRRAGRADRS